MKDTSRLLAKVIQEQGIPRSVLIRSSGIDRSSFYQILNGKRPGTIDQFVRIISQLRLTSELTRQLISEYAARKFGADYPLYEMTDRRMRKLAAAGRNSGRSVNVGTREIAGLLRQILHSAQGDSGSTLYIYIPLTLLDFISGEVEDIPELLDSIRDPGRIRILVSVNLQEAAKTEAQLDLLSGFLFGLYHIRNFSEIVRCIYSDSRGEDTPFPYFAVSGESLYLMNHTCDRAVIIKQKDVAEEYARFFTNLAGQHYEYLEEHASLESFMKAVCRRFAENAGEDRLNRMAERHLCIFKVIDQKLIERYTDPAVHEFLQSYLVRFRQMQSVSLNSASALQEFRTDHSLLENGIRITIDPGDAEQICRYAELPETQDIQLLRGDQDHLPHNWTFVLFSTGELMILPNWDCHQIISIRDQQIYHAFSAWFEVSREIALIMEKLTEQTHT